MKAKLVKLVYYPDQQSRNTRLPEDDADALKYVAVLTIRTILLIYYVYKPTICTKFL